MDNANNSKSVGSFTVGEFCGRWGASYFRGTSERGSDQGVSEATCEAAVKRVKEIAEIYGLPYSVIRTRTAEGSWSVAA
jgi:hypothetical protein